jgi:hypothetical protein
MVDSRVEEVEEAGEEDITMGEDPTATAAVKITVTSIEPEVERRAPAAANV